MSDANDEWDDSWGRRILRDVPYGYGPDKPRAQVTGRISALSVDHPLKAHPIPGGCEFRQWEAGRDVRIRIVFENPVEHVEWTLDEMAGKRARLTIEPAEYEPPTADHARAVELRDAWRAMHQDYQWKGAGWHGVNDAIRAILDAHGLTLEGDE